MIGLQGIEKGISRKKDATQFLEEGRPSVGVQIQPRNAMKREAKISMMNRQTVRPGTAAKSSEGFPVTYSTLSPQALQDRLVTRYHLVPPVKCEYVYRGMNDNYLVTDSQAKYIFRVYRHDWRDICDVESEIELIHYLKSGGIGVSTPIADRKMRVIQGIDAPEGIRYGVLFSHAEGGPPLPEMTEQQAWTIGREVSKMHRLTEKKSLENYRCHLDVTKLLFTSFHAIRPFLENSDDDTALLDDIVTRLAVRFEKTPLDNLSFGICHGDLHPSNYHVSSDERITMFDFDACCRSWLMMDVGAFCYATTQIYRNASKLNKSFIGGYRDIRPLNRTELGLIPYFGAVHKVWALATQCMNFEIFSAFVRTNMKRNVIQNFHRYVEKVCG
jgi:Ser/Thr protein kinase RdoA (MazF antagonist)